MKKKEKLAEISEKIEKAKSDIAHAEKNFVEQFKLQEEISKKLNRLYQNLSNPVSVDWQKIDRELNDLEQVLGNFLANLEQSQNLEEAKSQSLSVKKSFDKFKITAKQVLINPQENLHKAKLELDEAARAKEELAAKSYFRAAGICPGSKFLWIFWKKSIRF